MEKQHDDVASRCDHGEQKEPWARVVRWMSRLFDLHRLRQLATMTCSRPLAFAADNADDEEKAANFSALGKRASRLPTW